MSSWSSSPTARSRARATRSAGADALCALQRLARVGNLVQEEILRRQIVVRSTMEIDNLEGVVAMVANGLGASVVPARA